MLSAQTIILKLQGKLKVFYNIYLLIDSKATDAYLKARSKLLIGINGSNSSFPQKK